MASALSPDKNVERRKRVFVGQLPPDFLRITATSRQQQEQEAADQQAAYALQQQMVGIPYVQNATGRLSITVAQAKLAKNYGLLTMDPYVRLRVGHCVYETPTENSGGKNPKWNKVVQCLLPTGVNSIYLEIYDECSFSMDELIAWTHVPIPQVVMNGETHEDWYPLNGKQGDGQEGMINLVLSYNVINTPAPMYKYPQYPTMGNVVMVPTNVYGMRPAYAPVVYAQQPAQQPLAQPAPPPQLSEQELKQIEEMFPNMDKEVIRSVSEASNGNKDKTVNSLLQMCD